MTLNVVVDVLGVMMVVAILIYIVYGYNVFVLL